MICSSLNRLLFIGSAPHYRAELYFYLVHFFGVRPSALAEYVSSSVKSGKALPADEASANLLANKIREVSTEKPTAVGPTPALAAAITGKVYKFLPLTRLT